MLLNQGLLTVADSYPVPIPPKEQALNYLEGKKAARLKIKEEKTFQRELFTGHDSGASDVPLQPGSQLQHKSPSLPFFFVSEETVQHDAVQILSPYSFYYQHRMLFVSSQCFSEFSPLLFLCRQVPRGARDRRFRWDSAGRELPFGKVISSTLRV